MNGEKNKKTRVLWIVLALSLCVNFMQVAFLVDQRITRNQEIQQPSFDPNATYADDVENRLKRTLFSLTNGAGEQEGKTFYYFTESPKKTMAQGTWELSDDGTAVLRQKEGAIYGYVIPQGGDYIQIVWTDGQLTRMQAFMDVAVIP